MLELERRGNKVVFIITAFKGGVGKTTLLSNLSYFFAKKNKDKKLLLIDLDIQADLTSLSNTEYNNLNFYNMKGKNNKFVLFRKEIENLYVLKSSLLNSKIKINDENSIKNYLKIIEDLEKEYIILIDTPPTINFFVFKLMEKYKTIVVGESSSFSINAIKKIKNNISNDFIFVHNKTNKKSSNLKFNKFLEKMLINKTNDLNLNEWINIANLNSVPYCFNTKTETKLKTSFENIYNQIAIWGEKNEQ